MTHFEYLTTFMSFLYAIMVGRVFMTLSGLSFKSIDWRHVGWLVVIVANLLQAWWKIWGFHDLPLTYGLYLALIAHTVPFMFAVGVLTPNTAPDDWSSYFNSVRVRFFLSYCAFWLTMGLSNFLFTGIWYTTLVPFLLTLLAAVSKNRFVQWGVLTLLLTLFVLIGIRMSQAVPSSPFFL